MSWRFTSETLYNLFRCYNKFSKTQEEHINRLYKVFKKMTTVGIKLKPKKSEFLKPKMGYLGHYISKGGIETNPKKIEAIVKDHKL